MLRRIGMAIVVCLVTILACFFLARVVLANINISIATDIGEFLERFAVALGLLVGAWWYFFRGGAA